MIARKISLVSGIFLFAFVLAHLLNHSLGLISVEAMDEARQWLLAPWTNSVGAGLLLLSLLVHFLLGMRSLYRRNTLKLSNFDWFQLLLGLSIPALLLPHMVTAMLLPQIADFHLSYKGVLKFMWVVDPWTGLRQVLGLLAVWLHGCMGLFIWLRMQPWWGRVSLIVYPTVVVLPTLALLGFVEAGKSVIAEHQRENATVSAAPSDSNDAYGAFSSGDVYSANTDNSATDDDTTGGYSNAGDNYGSGYNNSYGTPSSADSESDHGSDYADENTSSAEPEQQYFYGKDIDPVLQSAVRNSLLGYLAILLLTLVARAIRLRGHPGIANIQFEGEPVVHSKAGVTILEISRMNDIGHASLCGGKGRCGTCQVRVISGAENLESMQAVERGKLQQIEAADDIRLACQARVRAGDLSLSHVLPGYVQAQDMPATVHQSLATGESS